MEDTWYYTGGGNIGAIGKLVEAKHMAADIEGLEQRSLDFLLASNILTTGKILSLWSHLCR